MGHVLNYVCTCISAHVGERKRELVDMQLKEMDRCQVPSILMNFDEKKSVKMYDPSGDMVDNLCHHEFSLSAILGTYFDSSCRVIVGSHFVNDSP